VHYTCLTANILWPTPAGSKIEPTHGRFKPLAGQHRPDRRVVLAWFLVAAALSTGLMLKNDYLFFHSGWAVLIVALVTTMLGYAYIPPAPTISKEETFDRDE